MNLKTPEAAGLAIGLGDALPRWLAAWRFAPGDGELVGPFVLANVHHESGMLGIGLSTMQAFGLAAALLAFYYALTRATARWLAPGHPGLRWARGCLAVVAGVLALNVGETLLSDKVTDYIGLARGSRVWMLNFGDVAVAGALVAYAALMAWALAGALRTRPA